jgi:hypothetical protein
MTMLTVWVLVMWVDCDSCGREPWVHEVFPTEAACTVQANRALAALGSLARDTQTRCVRSNLSQPKQ